jgi:hypothetical protein
MAYDYYSKISSNFGSTLGPSTISLPRIQEDILLGHLVFKMLVKMATWLWNKSERMDKVEAGKTQALVICSSPLYILCLFFHDQLEELFQNSAIQLKTLTELRISLIFALRSSDTPPDPVAQNTIDLLTRHIRLFGKFFRRLQQLSVARFVALPMCRDLVLYYWDKIVQATNGPPALISGNIFPSVFGTYFLSNNGFL